MDPGTHFELRNAQNFFGPPVLAGTYDGSPLHVPMNGLAPAGPVAWPAPAPTGPDFQVFVLLSTDPPKIARGRVDLLSSAPRTPVVVHREVPGNASGRLASIALSDVDGPSPTLQHAPGSPARVALEERSPCAVPASERLEGPRRDPPRSAGQSSPGPTRIQYFPEVAASARHTSCRTSILRCYRCGKESAPANTPPA